MKLTLNPSSTSILLPTKVWPPVAELLPVYDVRDRNSPRQAHARMIPGANARREYTWVESDVMNEIFSDGTLRLKFGYANIFPTLIFFYNYACTYARACMQNARKGGGRESARARSTKDAHPALLQAAAAIVRARIFINAHSSPPLLCFTRNFFELEIFSDDAARPKIKSHENLSNENFANEKRQITVVFVYNAAHSGL